MNGITLGPIDYEAQEDFRTLKRASEIRKNPKRMAKVEEHLSKELDAIGDAIEENELDVSTGTLAALARGYGKP